MPLKTIIFIGRSGCGKGTQVSKLIEHLKRIDSRNIVHVEAGALFRAFIKQNGYASSLSREISLDGGLQPEFLSIWAWSSQLINNLTPDDHLIADGTPRRLSEAYNLESAFNFFKRESVDVIYFDVSDEWAKERMRGRGRADDLEDSDLLRRLAWYKKEVMPAVEYFKTNPYYKIHNINGERPIEDVHKDILNALGL
jgi:adenylate kinase